MQVPTKELFSALPLPEQVAQLTRVDAKTRQELILSARNSLELTRALSSETLFYTLKEIGLADVVGLLALASPDQVRDMVDLDCWRKGRLDGQRILTWLMFIDEAGSGKLAEWFLHTDNELLVLLVKRHLEIVRKADMEDDPGFDQTCYFTFDDQYLLRFIGEEEPILHLLLEQLRVLDYDCYQSVLENSLFELEGSLEEGALRWRNARLADRGYPSYEEAAQIFHFVVPESLRLDQYRRALLSPIRFADDEERIPPDHALTLLDATDSLLLRAFAGLPPEELEQIGHELTYLTNQVVIAEAQDPAELAEVRRCVELVHGCLNIGLAYLAQDDEATASRLLRETLLRPFFQVGVSLTLRLQQQATHLDTSLQERGISAWDTYLDPPWRETYAGVRHPPPRFFLGLTTPGEILYRRFQALAEVRRVETVLAQVPRWFAVMRRWELFPAGRAAEGVTLATLWNTAFARWVVERKVEVQPLHRAELVILQTRLRSAGLERASAAFLALAAEHLRLTLEEGEALHALAAHAQERFQEVLRVDINSADLRFIGGLLVAT